MHDIIIFKFEYSCFCCYFKQPACRFNKLEFDCICKLNSQNEKITYNAKFATIEEYGATKKYADWLAEKTGYACVETKNANAVDLKPYDVILLGGGVYASGIAGLQFLKKNIGQLADKKIAVFAVGASPYDEKAIMQIREMHFKNELRSIPLFYCRGAWDEEKMKFMDRNLCKMLQKAVAKQNPDTYEPWQKALMCAVGQTCDWTDQSYLEPLLKQIEEWR